MNYEVFDRRLLRGRRRRATARAWRPATFLLDRVAAELADRLAAVLRRFPLAVDLGTPGEALRRALAADPRIETLIAVDSIPDSLPRSGRAVVADEEALPFRDGSLDLVVSALALHAVNDLPGTLAQVRRALKPDGLFLAAMLGGETLTELRQAFTIAEAEITGGAAPRVAPFADVPTLGLLLQRAGLALSVADRERITVRYGDPMALLQDLRGMGATNVLRDRSRRPLRRGVLLRMAEAYAERFADTDGRVRATFEIVWLSGWAPHESQQKPLRPGSAAARLADVLGTKEHSAGEKAGR